MLQIAKHLAANNVPCVSNPRLSAFLRRAGTSVARLQGVADGAAHAERQSDERPVAGLRRSAALPNGSISHERNIRDPAQERRTRYRESTDARSKTRKRRCAPVPMGAGRNGTPGKP